MVEVLEKEIERYLVRRVTQMGGKCYKFESSGNNGVPDRLVLFKGGILCFVELKKPHEKERALQLYVQEVIRGMGFTVFSTVDSKEKVDEVIEWAKGQYNGRSSKVT